MKVVALAEEMGRLIAAVQTKTERWLDQASVRDQLTRIREGAAELMTHLTPAGASAPKASKEKGGRSGGVDAPGKKHRSAPPNLRGARHADERIAKMKSAAAARSRSRG